MNQLLGLLMSLMLSFAVTAEISHLSKSIVDVAQLDCDPESIDCFYLTPALVEKNRNALIRDAALASSAAYNQKDVIAKVSKPIRSQYDDNARKIMRGLGEDVVTFGGPVPFGVVSYNPSHNRITVAFRGTESRADVAVDAKFLRVANKDLLSTGTIHSGFNDFYMNAQVDMFVAINQLARKHAAGKELHFLATGHSMGAAVATLAAVELKRLGYKVYLVNFSSPRLVDHAGAGEITNLLGDDYIMRIWRHKDVVAAVGMGWMGYEHIGHKSIRLETKGMLSPKANHKMRSILEDAFEQKEVEFVTDHVGFGTGVSRAGKLIYSTFNPMNWFSK